MAPSKSTLIGLWIFSVAALAFGGLEIYGVTEHLRNPAWPDHAKFHAVTGLFDELTLCLATLIVSWTWLRAGRRWSWWALGLIGLSLFGGLLIGNVLSHGGLSGGGESLGHPGIFTTLAWMVVILWGIGLALTWAHVDREGSSS